jgi:hypothetical protein
VDLDSLDLLRCGTGRIAQPNGVEGIPVDGDRDRQHVSLAVGADILCAQPDTAGDAR